uniref:C2H2-type domain-containing protein n=1 Tax=Glossina pallidipes TaxID=7398 RepID=A0A1A9ZCM0_GLOPL
MNIETADVANTETEFLMCFTETIVKEEPQIKGVAISARKRKRDEDSKVFNSKIKGGNVELPNDRFKCLPCDKIFSSRCNLKQHNKIYHFGAVPYRCEECGKRFPTNAILNAHVTHPGSDAKPHKCTLQPFKEKLQFVKKLYLLLNCNNKDWTLSREEQPLPKL